MQLASGLSRAGSWALNTLSARLDVTNNQKVESDIESTITMNLFGLTDLLTPPKRPNLENRIDEKCPKRL
jgi:hypothetical protein